MRTSTYRLSRKLDFHVTECSEVRAKSLLVASYATGGKRSPASELKWEEGEESKHGWTHVRHRVEDYSKWKEVFDSTAEYKRSHGWKVTESTPSKATTTICW